MRIGVFNGSFDPVHNGHIKMVNHILDKGVVDKVIIIPTDDYWDKKISTSLKDRIAMLKFFENEKIEVLDKYNELIYTIDLLKTLQANYPDDELCLMMGGDNLVNIERWKDYELLIKYFFIVYKRDDIDKTDLIQFFNKLNKDNYYIADIDNIDISSTYIRENIHNYSLIKDMIDYRVYEYYKGITC